MDLLEQFPVYSRTLADDKEKMYTKTSDGNTIRALCLPASLVRKLLQIANENSDLIDGDSLLSLFGHVAFAGILYSDNRILPPRPHLTYKEFGRTELTYVDRLEVWYSLPPVLQSLVPRSAIGPFLDSIGREYIPSQLVTIANGDMASEKERMLAFRSIDTWSVRVPQSVSAVRSDSIPRTMTDHRRKVLLPIRGEYLVLYRRDIIFYAQVVDIGDGDAGFHSFSTAAVVLEWVAPSEFDFESKYAKHTLDESEKDVSTRSTWSNERTTSDWSTL